MTAATARTVTVGWLEVGVWSPDGPLADVLAIATSFPRVEIVSTSREPSSTTYKCARRDYASKHVAFPDMRRDGCSPFTDADVGLRGYCFCPNDSFLEDIHFHNNKFLVDELISVSPLHCFCLRRTETLGVVRNGARMLAHLHPQARRASRTEWTRETRVEASPFSY